MPDITTVWGTQLGEGDWVLGSTDLQSGDDLETAVLISLFTDRRAEASDVIPDGTTNRRGWWGDLDQEYPIGSRLWLLSRAKQVPQTLMDAKSYCTEALQWLLDDKVAGSIDVTCSWIARGAIGIVIGIYDNAGNRIALYQWAWNGFS